MKRIVIIWHDLDHTRTVHEFSSAEEAEAWLRDVLVEWCPADELETNGYSPDGIGMLAYYIDEGLDDVGSLEPCIGGVGVGPEALRD